MKKFNHLITAFGLLLFAMLFSIIGCDGEFLETIKYTDVRSILVTGTNQAGSQPTAYDQPDTVDLILVDTMQFNIRMKYDVIVREHMANLLDIELIPNAMAFGIQTSTVNPIVGISILSIHAIDSICESGDELNEYLRGSARGYGRSQYERIDSMLSVTLPNLYASNYPVDIFDFGVKREIFKRGNTYQFTVNLKLAEGRELSTQTNAIYIK